MTVSVITSRYSYISKAIGLEYLLSTANQGFKYTTNPAGKL